MSERRPTLQEVIRRAVEVNARNVGTLIPAKVVKWDASKQKADCQILIKDVTEDEEGGRQATSWPVVTSVPVQFPGAGGYRITFPLSDGQTTTIDGSIPSATTGSLFYSHRSLDKWLTGNGGEVDPEFDHDHGQNDCVFFPGLNPFGAPLGDCPTDHMSIGSDASAGVQIHFHADKVVLGDENSAEFMFLCETLLADLKSAVTTLNTILQGGTTGSPVKQVIVQAAQWALTQLYLQLQASPSPYLSSKWKNK